MKEIGGSGKISWRFSSCKGIGRLIGYNRETLIMVRPTEANGAARSRSTGVTVDGRSQQK